MSVFEVLRESADKGELILAKGGFCRYHHRADGQITIYEILVLPRCRRQWRGGDMVKQLRQTPGVRCIVARCPAEYEANGFWARIGFRRVGTETTRTGKILNVWRLDLEAPDR